MRLPLTEQVEFQTALQRGNRVQVPKLVRWRFKLESDQVLKVSVWADVISWKTFYACMDKSGRITVPKVIQNEFLSEFGLQSLIGQKCKTGTCMNTKSLIIPSSTSFFLIEM
jgi:hypothetical protein